MSHDVVEQLKKITLLLTVTSGRSGTKLLTVLLADALRLAAAHEPAPRVNFVMRTFLEVPGAAEGWLVTEKLPAMLASSRNAFYGETSHLFCKGLIEPIISLGISPKLVMLTRPARDVACSFYRMNVIPGRTDNGRLVLLDPSDPGVLELPSWEDYSDYQLCYWYAREIERRQAAYINLCDSTGLEYLRIEMDQLGSATALADLAALCGASVEEHTLERQALIMTKNQNSRQSASGSPEDRILPLNLDEEEAAVDAGTAGSRVTKSRRFAS